MYSMTWAREVARQHYQKHARASYFLLTKAPFTSEALAKFIATRDPRWELWKKCVNILESYTVDDPEEGKYYTSVSVNGFSSYDQILKNLARTPLEAPFTGIGVGCRLEKQVLKARAALSGPGPADEDGQGPTLNLFGGRSL